VLRSGHDVAPAVSAARSARGRPGTASGTGRDEWGSRTRPGVRQGFDRRLGRGVRAPRRHDPCCGHGNRGSSGGRRLHRVLGWPRVRWGWWARTCTTTGPREHDYPSGCLRAARDRRHPIAPGAPAMPEGCDLRTWSALSQRPDSSIC